MREFFQVLNDYQGTALCIGLFILLVIIEIGTAIRYSKGK